MAITIDGNGTISGITAGGLPDNSVTSADIADAAITPAKLSQPLTLATSQASTSGTSIDFTGIPSWVKRITVMFNGVSTNGTSYVIVQLGTSGGVDAASYLGSSGATRNATTPVVITYSTGFVISSDPAAATVLHGAMVISNVTSNTWVSQFSIGITGNATATTSTGGGSKSLSGTLDRVRITTFGGTDTFDAGSINILYE